MDYKTIEKPPVSQFRVRPNLDDYDKIRNGFVYGDVIKELDGLPGGALNIAYEAIDRHLVHGRGDHVCWDWEGKDGAASSTPTPTRPACRTSSRNVLGRLGIKKGERVFVFMDRVPELYAAVFGTLKAGCVTGPLFSAFGPDAAGDRMADAGACVLVTSPRAAEEGAGDARRTAGAQARRSSSITAARIRSAKANSPGTTSCARPRPSIRSCTRRRRTRRSCTTRPARPASRRAPCTCTRLCSGHYATGKYVLDLHPDDIYWCTADPGWVTGTSYGMFAPHHQRRHLGDLRRRILRQQVVPGDPGYKVNVWYTAPTAIRLLMKAGESCRRSTTCRHCAT